MGTPDDFKVSPSTLTPKKVIQLYSDDEWEDFIAEWAEGFDPPYDKVEPLGGAGDKGRDIVCTTADGSTDIFQCKHYVQALQPHQIWTEIGKLCVFTQRGNYKLPRSYVFVAPRGVGTSLSDLIRNPDKLRASLLQNWTKHCARKISSSELIELTPVLRAHIEGIDFSIVDYVTPGRILEQHQRTAHWHTRFKRDYPERPSPQTAPSQIQPIELKYIRHLFDAYAEHTSAVVDKVNDLVEHEELHEHFKRSRTSFYSAEGLNRFYRDQFPEGTFGEVKTQVFDGVIEVAARSYPNGFERVLATVSHATAVILSHSEYVYCVTPADKKGICHHLANDDKLKWVK